MLYDYIKAHIFVDETKLPNEPPGVLLVPRVTLLKNEIMKTYK